MDLHAGWGLEFAIEGVETVVAEEPTIEHEQAGTLDVGLRYARDRVRCCS
jgi:hypothetical protein